jgi:hypothetical protein
MFTVKDKMTPELEKALDDVWLALDCYREDCIYSDEFESLRIKIGKQFNLIETTLVELYKEKASETTIT